MNLGTKGLLLAAFFAIWIASYALFAKSDFEASLGAVLRLNPASLALLAFIYGLSVATLACALVPMISRLGVKEDLVPIARRLMIAIFFDNITFQVSPFGEAVFAFLISKKHKIPFSKAAPIAAGMTLSWFAGLGVAILCIFLISLLGGVVSLTLLALGCLTLASACILLEVAKREGMEKAVGATARKLGLSLDLKTFFSSYRTVCSPASMAESSALQAAGHMLAIIFLYVTLQAIGIRLDFVSTGFAYSVASVTGVVFFFLPVSFDVAALAALAVYGTPLGPAAVAIGIFRFFYYWNFTILGAALSLFEPEIRKIGLL